MEYAYSASDLASAFKEAMGQLQALYKKELRPVYEKAWREVCQLDLAIEAMSEGWRRYRGGITKIKQDWLAGSPLRKALEKTRATWADLSSEIVDRLYTEHLTDAERHALRDKQTVVEKALLRCQEIDEGVQRAVRNYGGWPKESPKTALAAGVEALGEEMKKVALLF